MWWAACGVLLLFRACSSDFNTFGGYSYPQPLPPVIFDDPPTPAPIYLPPVFQDEPIPIPPAPTYLPPYPPLSQPPNPLEDSDTVVIPPPVSTLYDAPTPPQMRIVNMSCVTDNFFRCTVKFEGRSSLTSVVDDSTTEGCITQISPNFFRLEMEGKGKMAQCGVRGCSSGGARRVNMCVTLRMPTVAGLRLPEDPVVTLQCIPQETVATQVKHIKLGSNTISANSKARANSNAVATGGSQRGFDTRIMLLRRSPGSGTFDQPLESGSTVQLGEELVMRAVVNSADGWRFSRVGPVAVRSASTQRTALLVADDGCRPLAVRAVCPYQPRRAAPLDTLLHFRAFLFQGAPRGDDMVMSVRVVACLRRDDCLPTNELCEESNLAPPRTKRSLQNLTRRTSHNKEAFWDSEFSFKVNLPKENKNRSTIHNPFSSEFLIVGMLLTVCLVLLIVVVGLCARLKYK